MSCKIGLRHLSPRVWVIIMIRHTGSGVDCHKRRNFDTVINMLLAHLSMYLMVSRYALQ